MQLDKLFSWKIYLFEQVVKNIKNEKESLLENLNRQKHKIFY